ncbi:response regulator [Cognatishimia sp. F0-27]|uniref:response regulator n=1 Tax=Cognatishimia sp. F0-27 TaxID=2816855 RepID=UPI001D0C4C3C|nr:response regulator [Cognatishimia sp. F0-27]MCC1495067.1 response regulator [Cognatishimia sp. F0-27]
MFKVLLVEDDAPVREVLKKLLEREGITVITASNGYEAVKLIQTGGGMQVAILDRVLPGELDGTELVRALRDLCPELGIVQMSGYPRAKKSGEKSEIHDMHLTKPVRRQDLIDAVTYAIQAHSIHKRACA